MKCTIDPGQCVDSLRSKYVCFVLLACCLDGLPKMQQSLPKFRKRKQKSTLQATEVVISKSSLCSLFERVCAAGALNSKPGGRLRFADTKQLTWCRGSDSFCPFTVPGYYSVNIFLNKRELGSGQLTSILTFAYDIQRPSYPGQVSLPKLS